MNFLWALCFAATLSCTQSTFLKLNGLLDPEQFGTSNDIFLDKINHKYQQLLLYDSDTISAEKQTSVLCFDLSGEPELMKTVQTVEENESIFLYPLHVDDEIENIACYHSELTLFQSLRLVQRGVTVNALPLVFKIHSSLLALLSKEVSSNTQLVFQFNLVRSDPNLASAKKAAINEVSIFFVPNTVSVNLLIYATVVTPTQEDAHRFQELLQEFLAAPHIHRDASKLSSVFTFTESEQWTELRSRHLPVTADDAFQCHASTSDFIVHQHAVIMEASWLRSVPKACVVQLVEFAARRSEVQSVQA